MGGMLNKLTLNLNNQEASFPALFPLLTVDSRHSGACDFKGQILWKNRKVCYTHAPYSFHLGLLWWEQKAC
jgi:hypothetical protein